MKKTIPVNSTSTKITAVVLAGGQGRRMGGQDKGLVPLQGRPLVSWVLERVAPQVDEILVSANRNIEDYEAFGYPVITDTVAGFAGPLAGLQRALSQAAHPLVITLPCDTPLLPGDLVSRLLGALMEQDADLAIPISGGRTHQAICLCRRAVLGDLDRYLEAGGRRVGEWQQRLHRVEVAFNEPDAFANINTPEDIREIERLLDR
jgi:molybdopterin-guanine dinucleotide biosynthesis protein A